jgi:hypothetical protein
VEKHRSNLQYFKEKKSQSEIFNQLNIKKVKLIKIILGEKMKKKSEKKVKKNRKKKCIVNYCYNPQWIGCV